MCATPRKFRPSPPCRRIRTGDRFQAPAASHAGCPDTRRSPRSCRRDVEWCLDAFLRNEAKSAAACPRPEVAGHREDGADGAAPSTGRQAGRNGAGPVAQIGIGGSSGVADPGYNMEMPVVPLIVAAIRDRGDLGNKPWPTRQWRGRPMMTLTRTRRSRLATPSQSGPSESRGGHRMYRT